MLIPTRRTFRRSRHSMVYGRLRALVPQGVAGIVGVYVASVLLIGIIGCQSQRGRGGGQRPAEHGSSTPQTRRVFSSPEKPRDVAAVEDRLTREIYRVSFRYDENNRAMYVLTHPSGKRVDLGIGNEGFGAMYDILDTLSPGTCIEVSWSRGTFLEPSPPFDDFHEKALRELCERKQLVLAYR